MEHGPCKWSRHLYLFRQLADSLQAREKLLAGVPCWRRNHSDGANDDPHGSVSLPQRQGKDMYLLPFVVTWFKTWMPLGKSERWFPRLIPCHVATIQVRRCAVVKLPLSKWSYMLLVLPHEGANLIDIESRLRIDVMSGWHTSIQEKWVLVLYCCCIARFLALFSDYLVVQQFIWSNSWNCKCFKTSVF